MFHKTYKVEFLANTTIKMYFYDGKVFLYDISNLFEKYPEMKKLCNHDFFESGRLNSPYGVIWDENLDLEAETIYEEGEFVGEFEIPLEVKLGKMIFECRSNKSLTQIELSKLTGIDQSDISKIERGVSSPNISTIKRLADAMDMKVDIIFDEKQ